MKFIVAFVLTALLSYAAGFYFPWWSIALTAFAVAALIPQKPLQAFLSAFLSLFLLWAVLALMIDVNNEHILSQKVSALLFKTSSHALIIAVTGLVGALAAGCAALAGSFLRKTKEQSSARS